MAGPDPHDLRSYYQRLSDDALAELHAAGPDGYVPEAWDILDEEFRSRGSSATPTEASNVASRAEESPTEPATEPGEGPLDLVTVFASGNPVLIATAKLALESADIRFLTKGEGIQDLIGFGRLFGGFNIATGPVQIQVERRDAANAADQLRDIRERPQEDRERGSADRESPES